MHVSKRWTVSPTGTPNHVTQGEPKIWPNDQLYSGPAQMQGNADNSGEHSQFIHQLADGNKESVSWKEVMHSCETSSVEEHQQKCVTRLHKVLETQCKHKIDFVGTSDVDNYG